MTQRRKPKAASIDPRNMPTTALALMGLTDFVYAAREPLAVPQAMALREWVVRGGRLWIMADRVDPATARLILGNDWTCQEVSRTELPSVVFATGKSAEPAVEYEEPAQMVRMVAPGMEVTQTVDGWPAVMWRDIGKGSVVVTTVEPRVLGRQSGREEYPYWFESLGARFLGVQMKAGPENVSPQKVATETAMHDMALSIVGHEVVQRTPVLVILGLLGGALLVIGWRLGAKRRLELMAPAAVVLSVIATGSMLALGAMSRGSTPLTVAGMAEGLVPTSSSKVVFDGVVDIYSPSGFQGSLIAPLGGWATPDLKPQSGHLIRMRWSELERMRWDHVHFPSATLAARVSGTARQPEEISAAGSFGPEGFRGQLRGVPEAGKMETVIVGPGGRLAPSFTGTNFVAGQGHELLRNETTRGSISAEARHRIEAMQPWVATASRGDLTLYTWSKSIDAGVLVDQDGVGELKPERQLMTLLSVPLTIQRPTGNELFVIPPAFLKVNSVKVAELGGSTPLYDERKREFMGRIPTGAVSTMRFEIPRAALPLKVEKYTLRIDLSAPDRDVRIFTVKRGQKGRGAMQTVAEYKQPTSAITVEIPASVDMQPDAEGGVIVGIEVTHSDDQTSTWMLNDMSMTVTARAQQGGVAGGGGGAGGGT
jgi:hypothetical protein